VGGSENLRVEYGKYLQFGRTHDIISYDSTTWDALERLFHRPWFTEYLNMGDSKKLCCLVNQLHFAIMKKLHWMVGDIAICILDHTLTNKKEKNKGG